MERMAGFLPSPEPIPFPAPIWLLQALLFITFVLHIIPMNMTLGGLVILAHGEMSGRISEPLRRWITGYLPVTVAFTVTTGVAPLLFLQVLYGQLFFPAAVIIAWAWFGVIVALLLGYYGIYAYALASNRLGRWRSWVIIGSIVLFLYVAFAFNNVITLMSTPFRWQELWQERNPSTYFNLNIWEPTLFPRFGHFVLGAAAVAGLIAALYGSTLHKKGDEAGKELVRNGTSWFIGATILNYFIGVVFLFTHERTIWQAFVGGNTLATILIWIGVALSVIALFLAFLSRRAERPFSLVVIATTATLLTIVAMAGVKFTVRSLLIAHHAPSFSLKEMAVQPQWGIIVLFVILLLVGLLVVAWMLVQLQRAYAKKEQVT
jgi:MFS family permease